jgi:hypothetical protein
VARLDAAQKMSDPDSRVRDLKAAFRVRGGSWEPDAKLRALLEDAAFGKVRGITRLGGMVAQQSGRRTPSASRKRS